MRPSEQVAAAQTFIILAAPCHFIYSPPEFPSDCLFLSSAGHRPRHQTRAIVAPLDAPNNAKARAAGRLNGASETSGRNKPKTAPTPTYMARLSKPVRVSSFESGSPSKSAATRLAGNEMARMMGAQSSKRGISLLPVRSPMPVRIASGIKVPASTALRSRKMDALLVIHISQLRLSINQRITQAPQHQGCTSRQCRAMSTRRATHTCSCAMTWSRNLSSPRTRPGRPIRRVCRPTDIILGWVAPSA